MPASKKLMAFDLGAESGRGVLGMFDGGKLRLEVVHRFPNGPVRTLDTWHWDVLRLQAERGTRRRNGSGADGSACGTRLWVLRHSGCYRFVPGSSAARGAGGR